MKWWKKIHPARCQSIWIGQSCTQPIICKSSYFWLACKFIKEIPEANDFSWLPLGTNMRQRQVNLLFSITLLTGSIIKPVFSDEKMEVALLISEEVASAADNPELSVLSVSLTLQTSRCNIVWFPGRASSDSIDQPLRNSSTCTWLSTNTGASYSDQQELRTCKLMPKYINITYISTWFYGRMSKNIST